MTAISWKSGVNGSWNTAANWSGGIVPTINDDVSITATGTYTVTIGGNDFARSLTINDATAKIVDSGTLTLGGALAVTAGTFTLSSGGTINGGTITTGAAGRFVSAGGTLSGVSDQGTIDMSATSAAMYLAKGLDGAGTGVINDTGSSAVLYTLDSQTLDNATLNIGNGTNASYLYVEEGQTSAATLTLGAHFSLMQTGKYVQVNIDPQGNGSNALVNKGTITAAATNGNFAIYGSYAGDSFLNQGSIAVSNGDVFNLNSVASFTNSGVIAVSGAKSVLDIGGSTGLWSNSGSISVTSGATANLGGTFTLGNLGSLSNTAGTVSITGTLMNGGTTLSLGTGSALGTVGLSGGEIVGGTVVDAGGGLVSSNGTLSGVTYLGTLTMGNNTSLYVQNGLNVSSGGGTGVINDTGSSAFLHVQDSQTLDNATLNLGGVSTSYLYVEQEFSSATTLTLGAHLNLIAGKNAQINIDPQGSGSNALVNQGTITAAVAGGAFNFYAQYGTDLFANQGTIGVGGGDTLNLSNVVTFTNTGLVTASGTNTVIDFGGSWSNGGSITVASGATANLGGTFTLAGLNSIGNSGGTLNVTGTLLNTGTVFSVGAGSAAGTVGLSGTIQSGTVVDSGGGLIAQGGTLSGVTYQGTLALGDNATLNVAGGLNVSSGGSTGIINDTGNSSFLVFQDTQTLDNATLTLGGSNGTSYLYVEQAAGASTTLTLGAHLNLVAGKNAQINIDPQGNGTDTLVNQGTITAAAANGSFNVYAQYSGDGLINQGTIAVANGDTLNMSNVQTFANAGLLTASGANTVLDLGGIWTNAGTISVGGGATANLGGTFTLATLSSLSDAGGTLNITGTLTNTGAVLSLGAGSALGAVGLSGVIAGGTIADAGGGLVAQGGTLSGVTYQGALTIGDNSGLVLAGANVFTGAGGAGAGTINVTGAGSILYTVDNTTLDNLTLTLGGVSKADRLTLTYASSSYQTLTLGAHLSLVQSASGSSDVIDLYSQSNAGGILINQGTITAAAHAGSFQVYGGSSGSGYNCTFNNQGSVVVSNGDTFDLSTVTTFTNLKAGTLTGGSFEVDAGSVLQLAQNAVITTDNSAITLSGAGSTIQSVNSTSGKQVTIDQKLTSISATGALNLLAGRSFSASAAFTDAGLLRLGGGTFTTTGLTLAAGGRLAGFGTLAAPLADSGTAEAAGGTLVLAGSITGTGALQIDAGATLDIKANTSTSETASFSGQGGVLRLDSAAGFASVIAGYAAGDVISIGTLTATAAGFSGSTLNVSLTGGSTLSETLSTSPASEHVGISADGHSLTAFRFAAASLHAPEPVAFGNHHVGDAVGMALSLTNIAAADGYSEKLDASLSGASAGLTATGNFTGLAAGATDGTDLVVGLNTGAAGSISGTAVIGLSTDGTGIDQSGATSLGSQTVTVTGAVYAYAAASPANGGTVALGNVHVGGSATGFLSLSNSAAANGYAEALDASLGGASAGFSASGSFTGLAAGSTNSNGLSVGLTAGSVGALSGTATLSLASDGNGIDGLGVTALGTQTVAITGTAYGYAAAQLASTSINLGVVHVGDLAQMALSLGNTAAANGFYEALDAAFGSLTGGISASGSVSLLGAGATDATDLLLRLATSSSGTISGTALLNLLSDGTGIDGLGTTSLGSQTVTVSGVVDTYALAAFTDGAGPAISGSGTQYTLNLGTVVQGGTALSVSLGALNAALGLSDLLGGTIATAGGAGFTNSGFGTFSGLGAGQGELAQTVSLATSSAGTFTETVVLTSAGSNASGYSGALATETLTITGVVNSGSGSTTYTLAAGPNVITGAAGGDVFVAVAGSLNSRDQLTGGNGPNVMQLSGGGIFDLGAPGVYSNIPVINAVEGQAALKTAPDTRQTVYLRDGTNETLTVAAGTPASGNTNAEAIKIYGGTGSDTITLAAGMDSVVLYTGTDTVVLGGALNNVTAGGGTALVQATATQATAAILGNSSSTTTLEITTAGTVKLNALDSYLTVKLDGATKLTLGGLGFITVNGGNGGDTIVAGGANQTLIGGLKDVLTGYSGGGDTFLGSSAAINGDSIGNWASGDTLDLTDMNSTTLQALSFAAGKLTVKDGLHTSVVTFSGSGLALHNFTVVGSDGHGGTVIGYHS